MNMIRQMLGLHNKKQLDEDFAPLPDGMFELTTVYLIRYVLTGVLWLLYGVLNFFDDNSMPLKITSSILMALAIFCIMFSIFVRQEKEDDFSAKHLGQACQYVLATVVFLIMIFSVISTFIEVTLDFLLVYPFLLGGILLSVGLIWLHLERVAFWR